MAGFLRSALKYLGHSINICCSTIQKLALKHDHKAQAYLEIVEAVLNLIPKLCCLKEWNTLMLNLKELRNNIILASTIIESKQISEVDCSSEKLKLKISLHFQLFVIMSYFLPN